MTAVRETKSFRILELKSDAEKGTFKGHAATWQEDQGGDIIAPGSFAKTISERGPKALQDGKYKSDIKVLWQHDSRMPIGLPTVLREDAQGLYFEAFTIDTECAKMAQECMRQNVVDKISIGYTVKQCSVRYDDDGSYLGRNITEIKLYELSPITFPMNEGADINEAKGIDALLRDSLPLLTKDNAAIVLREIEKAGDCPEWLKRFLRALEITKEPRPSGTGEKSTPKDQEPPASKNEPPQLESAALHSLLRTTADVNAKLAKMLADRTGPA